MPVCRFHGAHRKILKGEHHHNYRHGKETLATRKYRHDMALELARLEEIGFALGILQGSRTRGRKAVKNGHSQKNPLSIR